MPSRVVVARGEDPFKLVERGLKHFEKPTQHRVVVKPNLIIDEPPPTTTPCDTIEALIRYYLEEGYEVIVAEGSGWCETSKAFRKLGYTKLAQEYGVKLVDLNTDRYELVANPSALYLKRFEKPLTLKEAYIISAPVLKEHSITQVTISLKNMLGATLGEKAKVAKKGRFHRKLDESIVDINMYLKPQLAIVDARTAGIRGELKSTPLKLGVMLFSSDLVAADSIASTLLGKNPLKIGHIKLAQKAGLGTADPTKIKVDYI